MSLIISVKISFLVYIYSKKEVFLSFFAILEM